MEAIDLLVSYLAQVRTKTPLKAPSPVLISLKCEAHNMSRGPEVVTCRGEQPQSDDKMRLGAEAGPRPLASLSGDTAV